MDVDRSRSRSPPSARQVRHHTEALFNLKSLGNMKLWRAVPMVDKENFDELSKVYESSHSSVPLSFIAQHTLVPGGADARSQRYVQDYVLGVKALARYVAGVESMPTKFLETELKNFLRLLNLRLRQRRRQMSCTGA